MVWRRPQLLGNQHLSTWGTITCPVLPTKSLRQGPDRKDV